MQKYNIVMIVDHIIAVIPFICRSDKTRKDRYTW